jgi:hypothetical protein
MTIAGVERDLKRIIKGIHTRYTNEAADRLGEFDRPALIARRSLLQADARAAARAGAAKRAPRLDRERPQPLARGRARPARRVDRRLRAGELGSAELPLTTSLAGRRSSWRGGGNETSPY